MGRYVSKEEALNAARTRGQPDLMVSHVQPEETVLSQDPPTFGESVQHGMERQGIGIQQRVAGMGEAVNLLPEGTTQAITDRLNEKTQQYIQSRRNVEGTDYGQFVGEMLPWAGASLLTEGAAMGLKGAPLGIKEMAKMGGVEGGVIGAVQPTQSPYGSTQYLTESAVSTGGGGVIGAAGPPLVVGGVRGMFWLGKPIKKGVNGLIRFSTGKASHKNVSLDVKPFIKELGMNWDTMTDGVRQRLSSSVAEQVSKRSGLDRHAIARATVLDGLEYKGSIAPTRGQLTQHSGELFNEAELAKLEGIGEPLRARHEGQQLHYRGLLNEAGMGMNVETLTPEGTGNLAIDQVNDLWKGSQDHVGTFYNDVRESATWNNIVGMDNVLDTLSYLDELALDDTRAFRSAQKYLKKHGGDRITVGRSERFRKNMGEIANGRDPTEMMAARQIIDAIDDDNINTFGRDPHKKARDMARQRFGIKKDPLLKKMLEDRIRPENFVKTQIIGGNGKSNQALKEVLTNPIDLGTEQARQDAQSKGRYVVNAIRGALWEYLVEKAAPVTYGGKQKVFGTGLGRAIKSINPDVLKVWFDQGERESIALLAQSGEWLFDRVENFSHTGASLKNDMLKVMRSQGGSVTGKLPVVGPMAHAAGVGSRQSGLRREVAEAMAGGVPLRSGFQEGVERITGRLAPRVGVIGMEERKR